jgi:hypothetical protein
MAIVIERYHAKQSRWRKFNEANFNGAGCTMAASWMREA